MLYSFIRIGGVFTRLSTLLQGEEEELDTGSPSAADFPGLTLTV